jgi:hypothetical protein
MWVRGAGIKKYVGSAMESVSALRTAREKHNQDLAGSGARKQKSSRTAAAQRKSEEYLESV